MPSHASPPTRTTWWTALPLLTLVGCSGIDLAKDPQAMRQQLAEPYASRMISPKSVEGDLRGLDQLRLDLGNNGGLEVGQAPRVASIWLPEEAAAILPERPISISLKDATLRQTVWILSKELNVNLMLDDGALAMNQKTNINLVDVDARSALGDILRSFDASAHVSSGNSLIISADISQSFYIDPNLSRSGFVSGVGGDLLGAAKDAPLRHSKLVSDDFGTKTDPFDQFAKLIEVMLSSEADALKGEGRSKPVFGIDRAKGVVFVRARPSRVATISQLIARVTEAGARQVDIDAQIIDVELSDRHQFGIDWNLLSKNVAAVIGASSVSVPAASTATTGGLAPKLVEFTGRTAGSTQGGSGLMFGNDSIAATVNAIRSFGNVKVVASPTVRLRSGTVSNLTVGDVIRYVQNIKSDATQGGGTSTQVTTESLFSGVSFSVGGRVNESGLIELFVSPSQNTVDEGSLRLVQVNDKASLSLPRVKTKSASSWVVMKPGAIIVMGGLLDTTQDNTDEGPPLLSEAPGPFGGIFRKESRLRRSRELLVVLRANLAS